MKVRKAYAKRGLVGALTKPRATLEDALKFSVKQEEGVSIVVGMLCATCGGLLGVLIVEQVLHGLFWGGPLQDIATAGSFLVWVPICAWLLLLWKVHERWGIAAFVGVFVDEFRLMMSERGR